MQHELGLRCGAFDVNAACCGFIYGLVVAHGLIAMGAKKVLVIGTDTLARITDWTDRNTAILFADGSGAVVLEAVEGPGQLLGWDLDADGAAERFLYAEVGGFIHMDGKEVFRRAVRIMVDSAEKSMNHAGVTADDIALVVPHQANIRIIEAACDRLGIPMERAATVLHRTGNTSSASIPLALADALDDGRVQQGDLVLLVGFGAGMTAASAVLRWGGGADQRYRHEPSRPRHRRFAWHRPRLRAALRRARRPGGGHLQQLAAARRLLRRAVRRHVDGRSVDAAFAAVEAQFGPVRGARVQRRHHQRRPAAAHERGRLHLRRSTPTSPPPTGSPSAPRRACCAPATGASSSCRRWSACSARPGRPTTPRRKAGLVGLARSLARELGSRSITVNVVAPGPVATDMTAALGEKRLAELTAAVPLGRMATADEIAGVVAFLASADAAYITGAVIPVDGGLGMGH